MPIYEYQCQSCQRTLEFIQKFSDPLLTECPRCHGKLEKLVSLPNFELKGTGWYATDFKNTDKPSTTDKKPSEEVKTSSETSDKSADKNTQDTHASSTD